MWDAATGSICARSCRKAGAVTPSALTCPPGCQDVPLSIPSAQPVTTYVASLREPSLAWIGQPLDFDAVLDDIAVRVDEVIQAQGSFRATTHMGVFICR